MGISKYLEFSLGTVSRIGLLRVEASAILPRLCFLLNGESSSVPYHILGDALCKSSTSFKYLAARAKLSSTKKQEDTSKGVLGLIMGVWGLHQAFVPPYPKTLSPAPQKVLKILEKQRP